MLQALPDQSSTDAEAPGSASSSQKCLEQVELDSELNPPCAICFGEGPYVSLPCKCATQYCVPCWDHAIASSIWSCGLARCPSCRLSIEVDVDVETCALSFATAPESSPDTCSPTTLLGWQAFFAKKTRHSHERLLKEHGVSAAAAQQELLPPCACGGKLQPTSIRERLLQVYGDPHKVGKLQGENFKSLMSCVLCGASAETCTAFWSCSKGLTAMMHPLGRDICSACFQKHTSLEIPIEMSLANFEQEKEKKEEAPAKPMWTRWRLEILPFAVLVVAVIVMLVVFIGGC
eukprot:gb/GFBE01070193.1/.p1 GENE.gb/GFBE01070193.1/~~gb/GFBE01070193.1/.p1  ORF type:complete len:290 (+),score=57.19 gb/GFBE01070193.1/:1-870(+)